MARSNSKSTSGQRQPASQRPSAAASRKTESARETVSARWLLTALAIVIPAAALCMWAAFCILFWQGSWQLLYHPTATVTRTPGSVGLAYEPVGFAATGDGVPQLQGWWISAAAPPKYTVLFLHDRAGNLSDTVDDLARLHAAGTNIFAFDYRGYGQSQFAHPSEARWCEDAASALEYLTGTRHVDPHTIVLAGRGLGANLALEIAAAHPELAGVVLAWPLDSPADAILNDGRAHLVPARLLIGDRWNLLAAASALRIPSLWFVDHQAAGQNGEQRISDAFARVTAPKTPFWIPPSQASQAEFKDALARWLDGLKR